MQVATGTIIQPTNRVDWVPGITVGVRGGIPQTRTNLIDVTKSPYNADKTGSSSAVTAIQNAIAAAQSNDVVYLPAGLYDCTSGLLFIANYVTIRGDGSNTVVVGSISLSHDPSASAIFQITNGASKGSTSITFSNTVDAFGSSVAIGDAFLVNSIISGNETFQYITSNGGEGAATGGRLIKQPILITSVSGNIMSFTPPLVWDFTNQTRAVSMNLTGVGSLRMNRGLGVENLTLTTTNSGLNSTAVFMLRMSMLADSWVSNCSLLYGNNYNVYFEDCVHCTVSHNSIRFSRGGGSNHSGIIAAHDSGCLIEDNIISDGLTPGLEWSDGFCGNAVFGNFFTNNVIDTLMHNVHPVMNLWEENVTSGFEIDGYFGSSSHQSIFRNQVINTMAIKRWSTFEQIVGNVQGNTTFSFVYSPTASNYAPNYGVYEFGYPNIGNTTYDSTSGPMPYNYPGNHLVGFFNEVLTNGIFTITNTQVSTNVIYGVFTNLTPITAAGNWSQYHLIFQDGVNTNMYWLNGGNIDESLATPAGAPTASNLTLTTSITVSNGWRVFIVNQNAYQWRQTSNYFTDTIHGNTVCTNMTDYTLVWDGAIADHNIPTSLIYTNGAPSWWGTNRWPAIDPTNSPVVATIPAEDRFNGIQSGGGGSSGPSTTINGTFSVGTIIQK